MPIMDCRSIPRLNDQEAHRALELLEEYHSKLTRPQDKQLKNAIERVIRIFKCRLFQALLDIQEFYEVTLLDDSKSVQQKTAETLQIACKWENSSLPLSSLTAGTLLDLELALPCIEPRIVCFASCPEEVTAQ